jgi:hypothetical protein
MNDRQAKAVKELELAAIARRQHDTPITRMHDEVEAALNELRGLFKEKCQLTFIMRMPGCDEADVLVTNDDIQELKKLLVRCEERALAQRSQERKPHASV